MNDADSTASIHPLNTLQVCIWCPRFLHARHIKSMDNAKHCLQASYNQIRRLCLCPVWETLSRYLAWRSRNLRNSVNDETFLLSLLNSSHFNCVLSSTFCCSITVRTVSNESLLLLPLMPDSAVSQHHKDVEAPCCCSSLWEPHTGYCGLLCSS